MNASAANPFSRSVVAASLSPLLPVYSQELPASSDAGCTRRGAVFRPRELPRKASHSDRHRSRHPGGLSSPSHAALVSILTRRFTDTAVVTSSPTWSRREQKLNRKLIHHNYVQTYALRNKSPHVNPNIIMNIIMMSCHHYIY